jgi:hypothetical protein
MASKDTQHFTAANFKAEVLDSEVPGARRYVRHLLETMSSKLTLSIAAALVLSAAAAGVVRAEPTGATNPAVRASATIDETSKAYSRSNALEDAEAGDPNSVNYANRPISKHSPTNDEIHAGEMGSPDSPDYRNRVIARDDDWKSECTSWNPETRTVRSPVKGRSSVSHLYKAFGSTLDGLHDESEYRLPKLSDNCGQ